MKRLLILALIIVLMAVMLTSVCFADEAVESPPIEDAEELEETAQNSLAAWWNEIRRYTPDEWSEYIDEHIMPWLSLSVSAIVGIYLAISPILNKIKQTSGIFDGAAGRLDEAEAVVSEAKRKFETATKENEKLVAEFKEVKEGYKRMIKSISNIERIVRLGFENSDELIVKGYAREIEKIGGAEDNEKA